MSTLRLSFDGFDEWNRIRMGRLSEEDEQIVRRFTTGGGLRYWYRLLGIGVKPSAPSPGLRPRFADARGRTGFYLGFRKIVYAARPSRAPGKHTQITKSGEAAQYQAYIERGEAVEWAGGKPSSEGNIDSNRQGRLTFWRQADDFADTNRRSRCGIRQYRVIGELPYEDMVGAAGRAMIMRRVGTWLGRRGLFWHGAVHLPPPDGDPRNYHVHFAILDRPAFFCGGHWNFSKGKERGIQNSFFRATLREVFADSVNDAYAQAGLKRRFDPSRHHDRLGWRAEAIHHMGPAVTALERRGKTTEIGIEIAWNESRDYSHALRLAAREQAEAAERTFERNRIRIARQVGTQAGDLGKLIPALDAQKRLRRARIEQIEAMAEAQWAAFRDRRLMQRAWHLVDTTHDPKADEAAITWIAHVRHQMEPVHAHLRRLVIDRTDVFDCAQEKARSAMDEVERMLAESSLQRLHELRKRHIEKLRKGKMTQQKWSEIGKTIEARFISAFLEYKRIHAETITAIGRKATSKLAEPEFREIIIRALPPVLRPRAEAYVRALTAASDAHGKLYDWNTIDQTPALSRRYVLTEQDIAAIGRAAQRYRRLIEAHERVARIPHIPGIPSHPPPTPPVRQPTPVAEPSSPAIPQVPTIKEAPLPSAKTPQIRRPIRKRDSYSY